MHFSKDNPFEVRQITEAFPNYFSQKDIGGILKQGNCPQQILRLLGGHYRILIKKIIQETQDHRGFTYLGQNELTDIPWNLGEIMVFHGLVKQRSS